MAQQPGNNSISLNFQAMDDFVREQQAIIDQKENVKPVPVKKSKILLDEEDVVIQNEALKEMGDENWIGKLTEYRQAHPVAGEGLDWTEQDMPGKFGPRFNCAVKIAENNESFGDGKYGFSTKVPFFDSKKIAKKYAAMRAVRWLIQHKHMPDDGSVKFPKAAVSAPAPKTARGPDEPSTSYASQVPDLCVRLGFTAPRYVITAALPSTPLWNGYADFGADPRIDGKVGEVKDVYGKKAAKEQVAKLVLDFLGDIERQRSGKESLVQSSPSEKDEKKSVVEEEKTSEEEKKVENEQNVEKKDNDEKEPEDENNDCDAEDDSKRKRSSSEPTITSIKAVKIGNVSNVAVSLPTCYGI
ncbi:hypothetical protein WAI453_001061 [Rhynchosporium graminicola]|uniref:DRBM domain-containing protein n=1 Tax=Rhynchosporium graminicola TaxID=2792576 RepID=A0A1E1K688_9HELO|nr:uncharacterized protein RCO7_10586 [Rhynchosporium commune]